MINLALRLTLWHFCVACVLVLFSLLITMQQLAAEIPSSRAWIGLDEVWLEPVSADRALLHYHNSNPPGSQSLGQSLQVGLIKVYVSVSVGANEETIRLTPEPGFIAIPDVLVILDGETGTALIVRPMF